MNNEERKFFIDSLRRVKEFQSKIKTFTPENLFALQEKLAQNIIKIEKKKKGLLKKDKRKYNYDIGIMKIIGDTIACNYISPYTLRQHFKHNNSSRDLIYNSGFKYELATAKKFSQEGHFVILNELTNCLRIGDLSILTPDGQPQLIEVKSFSNIPNEEALKRMRRQEKRMENLDNILNDSMRCLNKEELKITFPSWPIAKREYKKDVYFQKETIKSDRMVDEKTHYGNELNVLLRMVKNDGRSRFFTNEGIFGYKMIKAGFDNYDLDLIFPREKDFFDNNDPISLYDIYNRNSLHPAIPALPILFDPEIASDLIFGDLLLLVFVNVNKLAEYLNNNNVKVKTDDSEHFLVTRMCEIDSAYLSIDYPYVHLEYAVHTLDFFINYLKDLGESMIKTVNKLEEKSGEKPTFAKRV